MTRVIGAVLMVECPIPNECHVGWETCKGCQHNKYWGLTKYVIECGYDTSTSSKKGETPDE